MFVLQDTSLKGNQKKHKGETFHTGLFFNLRGANDSYICFKRLFLNLKDLAQETNAMLSKTGTFT